MWCFMLDDRADGSGKEVSMGGKRRGEVAGSCVTNVPPPSTLPRLWSLLLFSGSAALGRKPINFSSSAMERFHNKSRVQALEELDPS